MDNRPASTDDTRERVRQPEGGDLAAWVPDRSSPLMDTWNAAEGLSWAGHAVTLVRGEGAPYVLVEEDGEPRLSLDLTSAPAVAAAVQAAVHRVAGTSRAPSGATPPQEGGYRLTPEWQAALDLDSRRFANDRDRCQDCGLIDACDCRGQWSAPAAPQSVRSQVHAKRLPVGTVVETEGGHRGIATRLGQPERHIMWASGPEPKWSARVILLPGEDSTGGER